MQKVYLLLVISAFILFSSVSGTREQEVAACRNQSNTDCSTCQSVGNCGFCKNNKQCFLYDANNVFNAPCGVADIQYQTCVVTFRVWIIIVAILVGVVLLAILITICCLCRKCKQCKIRKVERSQQLDDQRMEERRAAAEVRTAARTDVTDQIRMKYGILKEKEGNIDYARMS